MTPAEWWLLFDCRRTDKPLGPNFSEDEMAELYELIGTDANDLGKGTEH